MRSFYKRNGLESHKKAFSAQSKVIFRVNRHHAFESDLADTLLECSPLSLCKLEACPVCMLHFRRGLVDEAMRIDLRCGGWSLATIIPEGHLYRAGDLQTADLPKLVRTVNKCIERSAFGDAIVVGGIDVSFNTFSNNDIGWQLEVQLMINRPCSDAMKSQVRAAFRLAERAHRPVMVKPVQPTSEDFFRCLTYSYKSMFSRRSSYLVPNRRGPDYPPEKQVRDLPLKAPQVVELAEWLGRYPIGARLILRNIKRTTPPGAALKLKSMAPLYPAVWQPVVEADEHDHDE